MLIYFPEQSLKKGPTKEPSGRYYSTICFNLALDIILQEKHSVYSIREVSLKSVSIYLRFTSI